MAVKKFGKVKLDILDNGTARATAAAVDAAGLPATLPSGSGAPTWTSSDPGATVTPDPADATGLSAIVAPAVPPVLVTGFTVSVNALLADGVTTISGTSSANNIVAGGPSGFQVAVA
jgi:hypothetical protein